MKIYDISQPLRPGIPTWPGDTQYSESRTWQLGGGTPVNVSRMELSTHTGTHADAPFHFDAAGEKIGSVDLTLYMGRCVVLDVSGATGSVEPEDLPDVHANPIDRVLLRTARQSDPNRWNPEFTAVSAAAIHRLASWGVRLIGVDAPSLDPESSKKMSAHHAAHRHRMAILEGLVLSDVPVGEYELVALPLKLMNLDASPVRAVLVKHDGT
jgi:arylformamidase